MISGLPEAVITFLENDGFGAVASVDAVSGGNINKASRVYTASGARFILKQNDGKAVRLFECEAAGLVTLREAGMRTPQVFAWGADFLLLEDLGPHTIGEVDWERYGRAVGHLHRHTHERFGFAYDNYLGPLPQINTWTDDGHAFFGQHRVLRYLSEPLVEPVLTPQDRQNLERLVKRLPDLIPYQPPALLHGDLWHTNMMTDSDGVPAVIDPAVYFGWPEAELSQTRLYGDGVVQQVFYDAYNEVNPLAPGWWERLELLYIRQLMAVTAFFGNQFNTLEQLRAIIAKFG